MSPWKAIRHRQASASHRWAILLGCAATLAGCGGDPEPVTIGASGAWNWLGTSTDGIELAVAEINASGGVRGRPLRIEYRDDDANGAKAAEIAQQFVADPSIVAVIGHTTSGASLSAAAVYDGRLVAVSPSASSPVLSGISPWFFRMIPSDLINGADLARFTSAQGYQRVAIYYDNDNYGRGLMESFRQSFAGEVVLNDPLPDGGADFEPHVAYLMEVRPDLVFGATRTEHGLQLLNEARRQGFEAQFIGGDSWAAIAEDSVVGPGVLIGMPFAAAGSDPEAQRFVKLFRERYGVDPDAFAALAYDATRLLARAMEEAGFRRSAVRDWLAGLDERTPFDGLKGPLYFSSGDPAGQSNVVVRVLHDGTTREIWR
ncbi:MAG: ABC transporter substrate-binding protein [Gemmatimonadota bacterium]